MFCLPPQALAKIKQAIETGKFTMEEFNTSSIKRREILSQIVGEENAKQVNLIFEKKLLLKNQESVMYKFIEEITGLDAARKAELKEKLGKTLAEKQEKIFDPTAHENLLNELAADIYSRKYRTEVSLEEAQQITDLAADLKVAKEKLTPGVNWQGTKEGLDFGAAKVALDNYVGSLDKIISDKKMFNPLKEEGIIGKGKAIIENGRIAASFIADNSRAIVASMDNSLWFRQGLKALMNPKYSKIWLKNFTQSWSDIAKVLRGGEKAAQQVLDGTKAEIYSRKSYQDGKYELGKKLDIGTGEEAYPTSWPSRIPVLGRLFRASEVAYEAGAMRLRADIADKAYSMAEKTGIDMTSKVEIGDINEVVNAMTGRGRIPVSEGVQRTLNSAFFSVKFFKSNLDFLTLHQGKLSNFATKMAAQNLASVVATTGVILGIAKSLYPDDNKDIFNTTSSNFGKIKLGNMTIDVTGGVSGLVVLASKIINQKTTSSTTGITTKLGEGYGSQTGMDVLWNFTENKFSPMFSVLKDLAKQETFEGKKPTLTSEAGKLVTPIIVSNINQLSGESGAKRILGLITDGIGLNTNVFVPSTDWGQNTGVEMTQFKERLGETKFKEANDLYNKKYNEWLASAKNNSKFTSLTSDEQQKLITNKKAEIKEGIFRQYGFKYKSVPTKKLPKI